MSVLVRSLVIAFAVALPVEAAGQTNDRLPLKGQYGISFAFPDGGGAGLGVRKLLSSTTNAGLELQFSVSHRNTEHPPAADVSASVWSFGLAPDVRLYRKIGVPVVPFLALDGIVRFQHAENSNVFSTGAGIGIGAEWFPIRSMSLSGSTGAVARYDHQEQPDGRIDNIVSLGLFHSELTLNLYF